MNKIVKNKTVSKKLPDTQRRTSSLCRPDIDNTWYKAVVQSAAEGFLLIKHPGGYILDTNDAFCKMLGYSRDELLSMQVKDIEVGFDESLETIRKRISLLVCGFPVLV